MVLRLALIILIFAAGCGDNNRREIKKSLTEQMIKTSCASCSFTASVTREEQGYAVTEKALVKKSGGSYLAVFGGTEKILITKEGIYLIDDSSKTAVFHDKESPAGVFFLNRLFIHHGERKGSEIMLPPVREGGVKYEKSVYDVLKRPHGVVISASVAEYSRRGTVKRITVTAPPYDAGGGAVRIDMPGITQTLEISDYKCGKNDRGLFSVPAGYVVKNMPVKQTQSQALK